MEFFVPVFNFVTDKSIKNIQKTFVIVLSLFILFYLDNAFGFTYYYNLNQKTTIDSQIHNTLKDKTLDTFTRQQLLTLDRQILLHTSIKDQFYDYIFSINKSLTPLQILLMWLTAGSCPITLIIIGTYFTYKALNDPITYILHRPISTIKNYLLIVSTIFLCMIVEVITLFTIPYLWGNVYFNCLLNMLINFAIFIIFGLIVGKIEDRRKEQKKLRAASKTT